MRKKDLLEQFHRDTISTAADKLFMEKGVEKTSMDEIAKEAEYSKATLYVYFKSKEELFHYTALKGMQTLHQLFIKILSSDESAIDQYMSICDEFAKYYDEHPLYFQSILGTIAIDSESRKHSAILDELYQTGELLNNDMDALIQKGIKEGYFREDLPSPATGITGWAFISGFVSFAGNKQEYITQRIGIEKKEFLHFGYRMFLQSILKEGILIE